MDDATVIRRVEIAEGITALVETTQDFRGRTEDVPLPTNIAGTIEEIGRAVMAAATALAPDKFGVEFGLEAGGEAGIPFVTKGTAKAAFKVSLEWTGAASANGQASA